MLFFLFSKGWSYVRIVQFDCRYVASEALNCHRFGSDARRAIGFHPLIKSLFHRVVIDPLFYLRQGYSRANLCIPACIIMAFHSRLGSALSNLNIQTMERELGSLNYRSVLSPGSIGIPLEQLSRLETLNSDPIGPSLLRLFPALGFFEGIAINQFRICRSQTDFRIFSVSLSKHSRSSNRFQIDLLVDNSDIRPERTEHSVNHSPTKHCLLITNLAKLVATMTGKSVKYYQAICRSCFRLFNAMDGSEGRLKHDASCTLETRGVLGRRKSRNVLIHRPFNRNDYTGKVHRNGLWFKRGFNYKRLKPLALGKTR